MIITLGNRTTLNQSRASTLVEAVIAMSVAGISIAALVGGFLSAESSSDAVSKALAANGLAVQGYEQVRGAKWDELSYPHVDDVMSSNFPPRAMVLDMPSSSTALIWATNYTTITTISSNPWVKLVRIDCVYPVANRGLRTNSIVSYRAAGTGQQNDQGITPPPNPTLPPTNGTSTSTLTNGRSIYVYTAPTNTGSSSSWNHDNYGSGVYGGSYWSSFTWDNNSSQNQAANQNIVAHKRYSSRGRH